MDLNQLYWLLKLGRPKHRATIYDIRNDVPGFVKNPVFFLSTGRCGTKWFSDLLQRDRSLAVFHQPVPSLALQGRKIYEFLAKEGGKLTEKEKSMIKELFWAAREDHIRYTYKTGKRYLETNNYITFFAPVLAEIFPDARFVHLVRHPGEFVRSGMSRKYYTETTMDRVRLSPVDEEMKSSWNSMGRLSKTAWLWNETNSRIEEMLENMPVSQQTRFIINDMSTASVQDLLTFLDISIPEHLINKQLPKKKNTQRHTLDPFSSWKESEKQEVTEITSGLAEKYGFSLRNK